MLISKEVETKWNSRNKKKFVELGYTFTKMKDSFFTKVEDTSISNKSSISFKCDFCGEIHKKRFDEYNKQRKITPMDCCDSVDCKNKKLELSVMKKYGETNISKTDYFKSKYKEVMNDKYGVNNYFELLDLTGENNHEWKDTNYTCTQCGKVEHRKESHINRNGNNFCSRECQSKFYTGDTFEDFKYPRSTKLYRLWRENVLQICNNKCFICDLDECSLHVHHLECMSFNTDIAFDEKNGVSLCKNHHDCSTNGSFHNIYGTHKNTKDQFIEYCKIYHNIDFEEKMNMLLNQKGE